MSTNGESARKWLEENRDYIKEPRILQIRDNLLKKIQQYEEQEEADTSEEYEGLLEALDVMESWLQENAAPQPVKPPTELPALETTPLGHNAFSEAPVLSEQEKQKKFQDLLKSSKG